LDKFSKCARGEDIPAGFVAHSTFWLICGAEVVGVSNVRHRLTEALRREGGNIGYGIRPSYRGRGLAHALLTKTLDEARRLGLGEVLLTCAKTNAASVRTITASGGVFLSEEYLEHRGEVVQRYRIGLSNSSNAL
jgi:predicted acetyltransferase